MSVEKRINYIAILDHWGVCMGFTSKKNFDNMDQESQKLFLEDYFDKNLNISVPCKIIEFTGPEISPLMSTDQCYGIFDQLNLTAHRVVTEAWENNK